MKTSKHALILLVIAIGLMACDKKNENSQRAIARTGTATGITGTAGAATGYVSNTYDMLTQVRGLLATETDSMEDIKSVSTTNGVTFKAIARFDTADRMIPGDSAINITITYLDTSNVQRKIEFGVPGSIGTANTLTYGGNRSADLLFEDEYGSIRMVGTYNYTEFAGDMYYSNKLTNSTGNLGKFRVQTCGMFHCSQ